MGKLKRFGSYTQTTRQLVDLTNLTLDGGTQPREAMDDALIEEYAARMICDDRGFVVDPEGIDWQKLVVYEDEEENLYLADGFHRTFAARRAGVTSFQADFREGSLRDAVAYSLGVNANHGKRRTNSDKRRAVERALRDEEWASWADARVARLCKVSRPFVSSVREALEVSGEIAFIEELVREDGRPQFREAPSPTPKTAAAPAKPPRSKRSQPRASEPLDATSFEALSTLTPHTRVIAYPVSLLDWTRLAESASNLLTEDGLLVCCLPQEDDLLFEGPATIARAVEGWKPRIIFHAEHDRFFACFGTRSTALPTRATSRQILATSTSPIIIGQSLDSWERV